MASDRALSILAGSMGQKVANLEVQNAVLQDELETARTELAELKSKVEAKATKTKPEKTEG